MEADQEEGLKGRDGKGIIEYLYSLGVIMDSEIAYKHIFAGDSMKDTDVARHRKAAIQILKKCRYEMSHEWLK